MDDEQEQSARAPAGRVAHRMDRLASQLLEISAPQPSTPCTKRLRIAPVGTDELESLAEQMGPRDGER